MQPVSDLTVHTGYWLRMVSNAVSHAFARRLAEEGVTVAEWVFLRSLQDAEGIAPTALAAQMGMTRGAISKLADRLAGKGLVLRVPGAGAGQVLSLSPEGRSKVPVLARHADENDGDFFAVLSHPERAALDDLLRILAQRRGLSVPPVD